MKQASVGDKIIVVNPVCSEGEYGVGDVGVVRLVFRNDVYVEFDNFDYSESKRRRTDGRDFYHYLYNSEYELYVEPSISKRIPKVGDIIKLTKSGVKVFPAITVKLGEVLSVDGTKVGVKFDADHGTFRLYEDEYEIVESQPELVKENEIMEQNNQHADKDTEDQIIKWEVGQEVWCLINGKGVVDNFIKEGEGCYPVFVRFESRDVYDRYTIDGKLYDAAHRSLFFSEPVVTAELFPPKKAFVPTFNKGDTVVVKSKDGRNTAVFYVREEDEENVIANSGCKYPKRSNKFFKLTEEVKFQ